MADLRRAAFRVKLELTALPVKPCTSTPDVAVVARFGMVSR
jgi:hypothetical protein